MATAATTRLPVLVSRNYSPSMLCKSNKLLLSRRKDFADFSRREYSGSYKAVDRSAMPARLRGIRCSSRPAEDGGGSNTVRGVAQLGLLTTEAVYILWLFLLPYAPYFNLRHHNIKQGDPVWAISSETINSLIGLSLNFFFILPLTNANGIKIRVAGIHLLEAPVLHPMSEGLFNFVIAWTLMFAPLLYTDQKRHWFKGSLDVLWGLQMFLTNTFLIPYMAIRMNEGEPNQPPRNTSKLGFVMVNGSQAVAVIGGAVCLLSIFWSFFGRSDGDFGSISDRWEFLRSYLGTERLAYAFVWDIVLYTIFQPWLIGDNLQNVRKSMVGTLSYIRFVPVVGMILYLLFLDKEQFDST
ncbi:hypothetical protein V2J09_004102 [Rumex salicifolius]